MKIKGIIKNAETLILASVSLLILVATFICFLIFRSSFVLFGGCFLVFLISLYCCYGWPFFMAILIPFTPLSFLWNICFVHKKTKIKKYINQFVLNKPKKAVMILADFKKLSASDLIKENYTLKELKAIVEYINIRKVDFSIYYQAKRSDIFKIMSDSTIREVYFIGHGATSTFQLDEENTIYYEDFNDPKYYKDFVHQVHCGTKDGTPLRDYVVPKENQEECFWKNKTITSKTAVKWFENKTKEANLKNK